MTCWRDVPPPVTVGVCEGCGGPWWVDEDDREQGCVTDGCPGYIDRPRRQRPESEAGMRLGFSHVKSKSQRQGGGGAS